MKTFEIDHEDWVEWYNGGQVAVGVRHGDEIRSPRYLYRVMSPAEFAQAERVGYFAPRPGERIHASSRPHRRYGEPGGSVVVRFRYDDADNWRAKWGDELYAVTNDRIPFDRAEVIDRSN